MKKWKKATIVVIVLLVALSATAATKGPDWLKKAVFYQIYPSSYKDSNGDGIGDIPGIISKLDYIQSIGVNAIWLNPLFESGWYDGGYDVIDFYKVDPRFGTNTDLVRLIEEAHQRGIKVCLDLVAGHTSDRSVWFKQSMEADANLQYSDYYIWTNEITAKDKKDLDRRSKESNPAESRIGKWIEANAPRAKYYERNYYACQPALNYGYANPDPKCPWQQNVDAPGPRATRQELKNIITFWFDKGIDGFRVDMAASLIKNDKTKEKTQELWREVRSWVDANYPEKVLISEWSYPYQAIPAGFHIDFMMHFGEKGYPSLFFSDYTHWGKRNKYVDCYFDKKGKGCIEEFINNYQRNYDATKELGYIALPSGNHDYVRLHAGTRNSVEQLKVAMCFLLTMPGIPFIYYGDEIGMKYQKGLTPKEGSKERSGSRTPMQWKDNATAGFSTCSPEQLYFPVDTEDGKWCVAAEEKDPHSLLNYVRSLLAIRQQSTAMGNDGEWKLISHVEHPYPMVYKRTLEDETYILALNPSERTVTATVEKQGFNKVTIISASGKGSYKSSKENDKVMLKPISAVIFKLEQ